jgi:hypothetical protein
MIESIRAARVFSLPRTDGFRDWVRHHDERWSFVLLYLGLAVGLSVFVSLFWLLVVAGLHFVLECGRQAHHRDGRAEVLSQALWEIKLDIGLVLLALTLVLYIDVVLGLLGIQSAARAAAVTRAGARLGSRAAAWERNIRTFLLTVDEMARLAYAAVMVRKGERGAAKARAERPDDPADTVDQTAADAAAEHVAGPTDELVATTPVGTVVESMAPAPNQGWRGSWGIADRIGLVLVAAGIALLLAAPVLTPHDWGTALTTILAELSPFRS